MGLFSFRASRSVLWGSFGLPTNSTSATRIFGPSSILKTISISLPLFSPVVYSTLAAPRSLLHQQVLDRFFTCCSLAGLCRRNTAAGPRLSP